MGLADQDRVPHAAGARRRKRSAECRNGGADGACDSARQAGDGSGGRPLDPARQSERLQRCRAAVFEERMMEYRLFGPTGVKVSPVCLGTMNFGGVTNE